MSTGHLVLRHTCQARNAFNPTLALISAFSSISTNIQTTRRAQSRRPTVQIVNLSTTDDAKQESQPASVESNGKPDEQRETAGVGNTHANYDTLNTDLHQATKALAQPQPSKRDAVARKHRPVNIQKDRSNTQTAQRATRNAIAEQNASANGRKPETGTQAVQRSTRNAETQQNQPFRIRTQEPDTRESQGKPDKRPRSGPQFASIGKFDVNTQDWQQHMQNIAKRALELSQMKVRLRDTENIELRRQRLDYHAWYIDAAKSPMEQSLAPPWTLNISETSKLPGLRILDGEIENFEKYLDCTPAEKAAREAVIAETTTFIARKIDGVNIEVFGSQKTGFATATSDIDVRLSSKEGSGKPKTLTEPMKKLVQALNHSNDFICVVMRGAQYPIINLQHKITGIDLQIVSAPDTNSQQEAIAQYVDELPHLRSIYMVLSTAFGTRGLVNVFNGGIGSYGLLMMLVASLKRRSSNPPSTAGEQLLRFLEFYSELDMERYGVSTSPSKLFKKHDAWEMTIKDRIDAARRRGDHVRAAQWAIGQRRLYQPYLFCLQDPANPVNDLGRKSNAIKHLQKTITVLRNTLRRDLEDVAALPRTLPPWQGDSLLLPLVGRCHEVYHERRNKIENYGLEVMMKDEAEHAKSFSEPESRLAKAEA